MTDQPLDPQAETQEPLPTDQTTVPTEQEPPDETAQPVQDEEIAPEPPTSDEESPVPDEPPAPPPDAVPVVDPANTLNPTIQEMTPEAVAATADLYTTNTWGSLPHFECTLCPYDSLSESDLVAHIAQAHPQPPADPAIQLPVYDRSGALIPNWDAYVTQLRATSPLSNPVKVPIRDRFGTIVAEQEA
jgi:hypothetical protein